MTTAVAVEFDPFSEGFVNGPFGAYQGRIALDLLDWMPSYEVDHSALRRVNMTNAMGYSDVPVRVND